jgi:uncharacterized membrane protein
VDNTVIDAGSNKSAEELASLKQVTMVVYALQALGFLTGGVTAIIAIVVNYVKREDVAGTLYQSHFDWQIRTFWWGCCGAWSGCCRSSSWSASRCSSWPGSGRSTASSKAGSS